VGAFGHWIESRTAKDLETYAIRLGVPIAAAVSIIVGVTLAVPAPLPDVALGSRWTLYGLRALGLFYGILLIFVPVIRSARGQLPIELSWRGAKYEDAAAAALRNLDDRLTQQAAVIDSLVTSLERAVGRIADLEEELP
jgi:hypothetical protein